MLQRDDIRDRPLFSSPAPQTIGFQDRLKMLVFFFLLTSWQYVLAYLNKEHNPNLEGV